MSEKYFDEELFKAIENFVDAKILWDSITRRKPFNAGLFQEAMKNAERKKEELKTRITQLTNIASGR